MPVNIQQIGDFIVYEREATEGGVRRAKGFVALCTRCPNYELFRGSEETLARAMAEHATSSEHRGIWKVKAG